jgi:hypothetical protein
VCICLVASSLSLSLPLSADVSILGGFICLTSLSTRGGAVASLIAALWNAIHQYMGPSFVGGCRPIDTESLLLISHQGAGGASDGRKWEIVFTHRNYFVPLETVIAKRI